MTVWAILAASLALYAPDTLYMDYVVLCHGPAMNYRHCALDYENPQGCIRRVREMCRDLHPPAKWPE